jgi:hypothetical protein
MGGWMTLWMGKGADGEGWLAGYEMLYEKKRKGE